MEEGWDINSWYTYNNYYKGSIENLNELEVWNKGDVNCVKKTPFNLYDGNGNIFRTEYNETYKTKKLDFKLDKRNIEYCIIQIDYDFYFIPITLRLSVYDGRERALNMLTEFGIKGFCRKELKEVYGGAYARRKYTIPRPIELSCNYSYMTRYNTKSFIDFDYNKYIENYNKALKKYPLWDKELNTLKEINLNIICDFYGIERSVFEKGKFDRLKYAIKALNIKINNKRKNN